jgi:hypothetical protein
MNSSNMNTGTNSTMDASGNASTTGNYNAYGNTSVNVPARFQTSFTAGYPGASNAVWSQVGDFYRASYNTNGRFTHVYYGNNGTSWTVNLPVLHSYVPEEVISKVGSMYGPSVYGIGQIKTASGQPVYQVHLIENGQSRMEWISEDGSRMQSTDIYRTEEATMDVNGTNMNSNTNMNNSGTNTNTSTSSDLNSGSGNTQMNTNNSTQTGTTDATNSTGTTNSSSLDNGTNNNSTDLNNTTSDPAMAPTTSDEKGSKMKSKTKDGKKTTTKG